MNYNSYKINNKNKNNDNLINNNINNKKLKKSTSANYSFGRLSKSKNNINNKSRNNNIFIILKKIIINQIIETRKHY